MPTLTLPQDQLNYLWGLFNDGMASSMPDMDKDELTMNIEIAAAFEAAGVHEYDVIGLTPAEYKAEATEWLQSIGED